MRYVRKNTMARSSTGGTLVLVQEVAGSSPAGQQTIREQHGANNKKTFTSDIGTFQFAISERNCRTSWS